MWSTLVPSTLRNQTLLSSPSQRQMESSVWFASAWKLQCLQQTAASLSHLIQVHLLLRPPHRSLRMLQERMIRINNLSQMCLFVRKCLFLRLQLHLCACKHIYPRTKSEWAKLTLNLYHHSVPISRASANQAVVAMVTSGVCASLRRIIMDVLLLNLY